jgi:hypothetical protein
MQIQITNKTNPQILVFLAFFPFALIDFTSLEFGAWNLEFQRYGRA